jgi:hypothetical protein
VPRVQNDPMPVRDEQFGRHLTQTISRTGDEDS